MISRRRTVPYRSRLAARAFICLLSALLLGGDSGGSSAYSPLGTSTLQQIQKTSDSGHQFVMLVVLLDTNPHQKKILAVELTLAEKIVQKLNTPGSVFSIITFGSQPPVLLKSEVHADEAITAIRGVTLDQTRERYFSVHLYDALNMALNQFTGDPRSKSLLVISEGNDYFPGKTFKQTVSRAQQLHVICNIAMVADHTLYGTKGLQRYGFDLRRLAGETRGQYVGGGIKRIPRTTDRLAESILSQARGNK